MNGSKIWLITGNLHKVKEAREVLSEYDIQLEQYKTERVEIQSDDPAKIAEYSLNQIPDDGRPMLVEDAGLFIDHYGGFPGPYSSYALEKLDNPGILNLMSKIQDRDAEDQSAIALRLNGEIHYFKGIVFISFRLLKDMINSFFYRRIFNIICRSIEKVASLDLS